LAQQPGGTRKFTVIWEMRVHMEGHHALRQSRMLAKRLLSAGMMNDADAKAVDRAVEALCTREAYPSHGSAIDRAEAKSLGLKIESLDNNDPLWDRIWLLYCMFDFDARRAGLAKMFEGPYRSLAVDAAT
jgi:pyruvate carboxylase